MIKKDMIIAVLITFCLTATLFMAKTTMSQTEYREYDSWYDVTGPIRDEPDGKIDVRDIYQLSLKYGTTGDPTRNVNITNWEVDCYHRYSVEIVVDMGSAAVGNAEPATCIVHVTYKGLPIRNLISDNFHVCSISSPLGSNPQGPSLYFKEATPYDGCYKLECKPYLGQQWLSGTYIFYIGVYDPAPPLSPVYNGVLMTSFTL